MNILCFAGAHASSVFDFHETLSVANKLASLTRMPRRLDVAFVGVRRRTTVYPGVTLATEPLARPADLVLIPGIEHARGAPVTLRLPLLRAETRYVRQCVQRGIWVGAVCGGTFLLAEAAREPRRIATSWWLEREFAARFPHHTLEPHVLAVSKRIITAGAV
ncbi:MAG: hypothetical protein HY302_10235, partial [Opitutae bacterium]|nr:hypothetical protein [Opitutae bacterium]